MTWPRGRWNGQRIVGLEVKARIDLLWWSLDWPRRGTVLSLGPLHFWISAAYRS